MRCLFRHFVPFVLAFSYVGIPQGATAQVAKVERELRLEDDEVPAAARAYVDSVFAKARRLKYYKDVGEGGTTVEAKFRLGDTRYSVEFSEDGHWLDTEVEIAVDSVPDVVWRDACPMWADSFELFRVLRVQRHVGRGDVRYYEVELRARRDFVWSAYQARLGEDGTVLEQKEIELSPGHLERW